ncbi:hypothetical protein LPJ81_003474 [Coemansia sp. IMI 209127]|nr:hypothetical protein LPJ81_003474 [Coemansia sp. IMI 209127]
MSEKFRVEAHHAYAKTKADELDLSPGDIILVSSDEHASWWVGHKEGTNEQGWFPSNFVKRIEPKAASKPKSKPKLKREVRIIKQYDAADEDDLSLMVGDIVEVKKEVDGWYLGRLNGSIGMFPVNYAEEYSAETQTTGSRPLPVPPVAGASNAPPPIPSILPVPGALPRRGTASGTALGGGGGGGGPPGAPPLLPSRTPPLPPRASTDISRLSEKMLVGVPAGEEGADDGKKEKSKSGHRISRLFGSKKHKQKEGQLEGVAELASARMDQQPPATLNDEEPADESSISPATSNRPLPQPGNMNSPPPPPPPSGGRAMPPIPGMGAANLPPLPTAGMPPQPQEQASLRRPSVSSIGTASSVSVAPTQPLPGVQKSASTVSAEHDDGNEQVSAVIAEDKEYNPDAEDEAGNENTEETDTVESMARAGPKLAKIIEDYEAESPEELNLMQGDVVTIISQGTDNEERWKGEYHGKRGYFPSQVVELIDENAERGEKDDESGEASSKPGGFKLAAYGVQQGGIGSIFAAGGMPALRKSAPRKNSEAEPPAASAAAPVPAPAQAPVIPKLRSVQRPTQKEEPQKEDQQQQQQPNFLAHLNRVPRKPMQTATSEESTSASPQPMAAPPVPISRKMTASSSAEPETADTGGTAGAAPAASVPELEPREEDDSMDYLDAAIVPQETSEGHIDASNEPTEAPNAEDELAGVEQDTEDAQGAAGDDFAEEANGDSVLDPLKSPALASVRRLVRRGPRQMPTAEGLKKGSEESQAQSLRSALQKDKLVEPEPEVEVETAKSARPALPEKPRGISGRFGQHGGPQLPSGGFKASGRVGSAMASRLAALQARASGNNEDEANNNDDDTAPNGAADTASGGVRGFGASNTSPVDAKSPPPPVGRKPSFTPRTSQGSEAHVSPTVSSEWQRQIEEEQTRLRSDINKARQGGDAVERLESRLAASERENQTYKQTIARLEEHIQALTNQMSALKTDISGIQRSVADMGSNKGVSASDVTAILRSELGGALQPLEKQTQSLSKENKALDKKIGELRAYVDELVVDEE